MSRVLTKKEGTLLQEASEMFDETGCVPGIDREQVPAEKIVPDVKKYISDTIDEPEAMYDPEIWEAPGFALVLSWLAQKWHQKCLKLAPGGSRNRPFLDLPNVIASPHNSAQGTGAHDISLRRAVENCHRALTGETPLHLIGPNERPI